jgi:hypothetical protein
MTSSGCSKTTKSLPSTLFLILLAATASAQDQDGQIHGMVTGTVTRVDWRNPHAWTRNIGELEPLQRGDSYRSKRFLPGFFERRSNTKYSDVVIGPGNDVQAGWYAVVANA